MAARHQARSRDPLVLRAQVKNKNSALKSSREYIPG
jgi:hypothetical protein